MTLRQSIILITGAGCAALLSSFLFTPQNWEVDSAAAKIHFVVPARKHFGDFSGLTCVFRFDPLSPSDSYINASVDVSTLTTDKEMLTRHLKMKEYFDAKQYPKITFTSDSVVKNDTSFIAYGKLTMKNRTLPVQMPFSFLRTGNGDIVNGTMELYSGDYNVGKKFGGKDLVLISIEVPVRPQ